MFNVKTYGVNAYMYTLEINREKEREREKKREERRKKEERGKERERERVQS